MLALLLLGSPVGAQEQEAETPQDPDPLFETWQDPLVYRTRAVLYWESNTRSDGHLNQMVLNPRFSLSEDDHNALDLVVPFSGSLAGGQRITAGLGDVEISYLHRYKEAGRWATGGGLQVIFNSATDPKLGDGRVLLVPSYGLSYWVSPSIKLLAFAEYRHSLHQEENVTPKRDLILRPTTFFYLPHEYYTAFQLRGTSNLRTGQWLTQIEVTVGKSLDAVEIYAAVRVPLNQAAWDTLDRSRVQVGVSYSF